MSNFLPLTVVGHCELADFKGWHSLCFGGSRPVGQRGCAEQVCRKASWCIFSGSKKVDLSLKNVIVAGAAIAVLAASTHAYAETISYYSSLDNETSFINGSTTLTLPQFTPSPGEILSGATLTLLGITSPQFEVLNFGAGSGTGRGTSGVIYTVTGTGVTALSAGGGTGTQTVTVPGVPPGGLYNLNSSSPTFVVLDATTNLTDLTALIGSGTVSYNVGELFTTSGTDITTPKATENLAFGGTTSSNFELEVTYDVPEPATLSLLGTSLLGLALFRRRRARSSMG